MQLSGKISEDLRRFAKPTSVSLGVGILNIWILVLGNDRVQFFSVHADAIEYIGDARSVGCSRNATETSDMFYNHLAKWLDDALEENPFDRLLLVRPQAVYGRWLENMTYAVLSRVHGEIAADLSELPLRNLLSSLKKIVWD